MAIVFDNAAGIGWGASVVKDTLASIDRQNAQRRELVHKAQTFKGQMLGEYAVALVRAGDEDGALVASMYGANAYDSASLLMGGTTNMVLPDPKAVAKENAANPATKAWENMVLSPNRFNTPQQNATAQQKGQGEQQPFNGGQ